MHGRLRTWNVAKKSLLLGEPSETVTKTLLKVFKHEMWM